MSNLKNIIAGILMTVSTTMPLHAQTPYDMCKVEVSNVLEEVRRIEKKNNSYYIGARIPLPLVGSLSEEQQLCIARGITAITKGDYRIRRYKTEDYVIFEFERIKERL